MNSISEAEKFEPENKFKKNVDEIKADHMKSITSLDMNLSAITSKKSPLSYENNNANLMTIILLQSPVK